METVAIVFFWLFVIGALVQAIGAACFAWKLIVPPQALPLDERWPKTAILLSLRGADAQLGESLKRLLNQDYASYELHVVVDNVADPAWPIVQSMVDRYGDRLHLSPLDERLSTCGLQCSSLAQAAKDISSDVEVIVTIDGDLMPHATWLRELVEPLLNPRVGASFGNRWFMPHQSNWGSLVRYLWNVAAVVPMQIFSIPWGGCFAIRRSAFDAIRLADCWSKSIVHDAPVKSLLNDLKLQVQFVPSLMMVLRETCSLSFSRDFLKRQMTWTRLYHPHWSPILLHAAATTGIWFVAGAMLVWGLATSQTTSTRYVATGLAIYWLTMVVLITLLEIGVRAVLKRRGEQRGWMSLPTLVKLVPAIPLTQAVYFVAVLEATLRRRVVWRGVTYLIHGPHDIRLVDERPFEQPVGEVNSQVSL